MGQGVGRVTTLVRELAVAGVATVGLDRVDQVGSRLMGEIDQVMAMVEAAMGQTAIHGEELRGAGSVVLLIFFAF